MLHKILNVKGTEVLDKATQTKINGGTLRPLCGRSCYLLPDCTDSLGCPVPNRPECVNYC